MRFVAAEGVTSGLSTTGRARHYCGGDAEEAAEHADCSRTPSVLPRADSRRAARYVSGAALTLAFGSGLMLGC
jgi:hypothetical protein